MHDTADFRLLTDERLLQAVLDRRTTNRAWQELLRRFRALIFRCITKVAARYDAVLSSEDANEIFGDVCLNLLRDDMRKLRAWDPSRGSKLGSWLGLLAINTAYDFLRQTARRPAVTYSEHTEHALEHAAVEPTALDALIDKERWSTLNALMTDFTDRDRRFVELYFALGMEPEEVASAMNISIKTVYSKKNKVRTRLAELASARRAA